MYISTSKKLLLLRVFDVKYVKNIEDLNL